MFDKITLTETTIFARQQEMIDQEADYFKELFQWLIAGQGGLTAIVVAGCTAALNASKVKIEDSSITKIVQQVDAVIPEHVEELIDITQVRDDIIQSLLRNLKPQITNRR